LSAWVGKEETTEDISEDNKASKVLFSPLSTGREGKRPPFGRDCGTKSKPAVFGLDSRPGVKSGAERPVKA
jgi:hypothetical protein